MDPAPSHRRRGRKHSTPFVCTSKYKLACVHQLSCAPCPVPGPLLALCGGGPDWGPPGFPGSCSCLPCLDSALPWMAGTGGTDGAGTPPQVPLKVAQIRLVGPAHTPFPLPHSRNWGSPGQCLTACGVLETRPLGLLLPLGVGQLAVMALGQQTCSHHGNGAGVSLTDRARQCPSKPFLRHQICWPPLA